MKLAETSECVQRHGAVIVKNGRVLAMGVNRWRNEFNALQTPEEIQEHLSVHAERDALRKIKNGSTKGATIYVARINNNGQPLFSRPCDRCWEAIIAAGIKDIVWT